jgi:protein-tyrosine phosphatase
MRDRIVELDGVRNFRDFGGYATASGGRVARGRLFRSAHFAEVSAKDLQVLEKLGVSLLVDLRRPEEREMEPNRWPTPPVTALTNDQGVLTKPAHIAAAEESDWSVEGVRAYMRSAYAAYPYEERYVALFGAFLRELSVHDGAAVVHCAAGKDRTGCLCALTLTLLGVSEEEVIADYEFTNVAVDIEKRLPESRARIAERYGTTPQDAALRAMMGVETDYLAGYFAAVHARYPRVTDYVEEVLGFDQAAQARLRQRLVG